jgi:putative membrane protein
MNYFRTLLPSLIITALSISASAQSAQKSAAPSDAQIAHIVVTANQIDIEAGKMAEGKTKNGEVKAFAKQMVTDHTAVNKQASDLAKKLNVTPEDNSTSQSLKTAAAESASKLKSLKGKDFDKAYVDQEVAFHAQVIGAIDQALLPNAKNQELKSLLEKTRPAIQAHLEHAQHIQKTLTK